MTMAKATNLNQTTTTAAQVSAARAATRRIETSLSGRSASESDSGRWPYDQEQGNRGIIAKVRTIAFHWPNSKSQQHYVYVKLLVKPEGEDRLVNVMYQAAWLPKFDPNNRERLMNGHVPTRDSVDEQYPLPACPDDFEGDIWDFYEKAGDKEDITGLDFSDMSEEEAESWSGYAITGKSKNLPKMDFIQFMESVERASKEGWPDNVYEEFWPVDDYRDLEGLDCHFTYVRPKYGMKKKKTDDNSAAAAGGADQKDTGEFLIPVVSDIFNLPAKAGGGDAESVEDKKTTATSSMVAAPAPVSNVTASSGTSTSTSGNKKKSALVIPDDVQEALREQVYQVVIGQENEIIDLPQLANECMLAMEGKQPEVFQLLSGPTLSEAFWASMPLVRKTKSGKVSLSDAGREKYEAEQV